MTHFARLVSKKTILLTAAVLAFLATSTISTAQSSADDTASKLAGTWKMTSVTPDGDAVEWKLTIKKSDSALTGTVSNSEGEGPAADFKVDGEKVHLKTTYQGGEYIIEVKLDGEKLTGTWAGGGDSGATSGIKAPPAVKS